VVTVELDEAMNLEHQFGSRPEGESAREDLSADAVEAFARIRPRGLDGGFCVSISI
jgi:hypothetical protein